MKSSTLVLLIVCFGLTVLIVCGGVPMDDVVYSKSPSSRNQRSSWDFDNEQQQPRTIRQTNLNPILPPKVNTEDPFKPLNPKRNNRTSGRNPKGTRPRTQPTTNPNPVQTSTTPSSNGEANELLRDTCNTHCRERTTSEYNPVCGSDSRTYQNRRFLECVANCGIQTELSYVGSCVRRR